MDAAKFLWIIVILIMYTSEYPIFKPQAGKKQLKTWQMSGIYELYQGMCSPPPCAAREVIYFYHVLAESLKRWKYYNDLLVQVTHSGC